MTSAGIKIQLQLLTVSRGWSWFSVVCIIFFLQGVPVALDKHILGFDTGGEFFFLFIYYRKDKQICLFSSCMAVGRDLQYNLAQRGRDRRSELDDQQTEGSAHFHVWKRQMNPSFLLRCDSEWGGSDPAPAAHRGAEGAADQDQRGHCSCSGHHSRPQDRPPAGQGWQMRARMLWDNGGSGGLNRGKTFCLKDINEFVFFLLHETGLFSIGNLINKRAQSSCVHMQHG